MKNLNISNARQDEIVTLIENTAFGGEILNIFTPKGNAIVISEEEYNNFMETIYICSVPGLKQKILESSAETLSECVPLEEVDW